MSNTELIAGARKFLATPNLGRDMARELNKALAYMWELADIAEAAEARIAELEAGEWEYGVKWHDGLDPVWYHPYTVDEAEKELAAWPKEPGYVVTRRKAGEWVPVESEGTDG